MLDNYKIGNQISLLRKEKGLTGEKFAELLGVSSQAVSKWENAKNLPDTSLLPFISKILGVSIDSLLLPKELLILNAVYTDGICEVDVTHTVENLVRNNKLYVICNPQCLNATLNSDRIAILTVKYKTQYGTFFHYAIQNSELMIDLTTEAHITKSSFRVIGAYYGNKNVFNDAMQKLKHYDYFKWNEIQVNHERFPSTPGTDETEYLTIIYLNAKGIHTISCKENETLVYSLNRTDLVLKDTSSCILQGIRTLEWEKGMDCTWAGAVYTALLYLGENYSYEQIMGMSGACYRIAFTEVWDWSATDALVAFNYSDILFAAIGYEPIWANRVEKGKRHIERSNIVKDIASGKPVIAMNLRIAPEWGVITGYRESGKAFYCRTYFDKEYLNENKDYLEADFWPYLIIHFGNKKDKSSETQILFTSLKTLVNSFEASYNHGYYQGLEAYEHWIKGLSDLSLWNEHNSRESIERRLGVNDSLLLNLIDARRCAANYLNQSMHVLSGEKAELLKGIVNDYSKIVKKLSEFRNRLKETEGDTIRYNCINISNHFSDEMRNKQIILLNDIKNIEVCIYRNARSILVESNHVQE